MVRRSVLSSPGSERAMLEKAAESDADEVILDLEDGVAPTQKDAARDIVVAALDDIDWDVSVLSVRVNGFGTGLAARDIRAVVSAAGSTLDTLFLPKVTDEHHVHTAATLLSELEDELGIADPLGLEISIEEVEAVQNVDDVAAASDRLEALMFGPGDYSASQGAQLDSMGAHSDSGQYPGDVWHYVRSRMAIAADANGLDCIDGPYGDFTDEEGHRAECRRARALGFDGKWAIHPAQVETINDVFSL